MSVAVACGAHGSLDLAQYTLFLWIRRQNSRKKQIDKFNKKHPKLLTKHTESHKMLCHADKQMEKAELRSTATFRSGAASAAAAETRPYTWSSRG